MKNVINVHDLKTNYSKYLDQVISGEKLLLGKHGKAVAMIIPLPLSKTSRTPGALRGKIWVSEDFDEPMTELWNTIGAKR